MIDNHRPPPDPCRECGRGPQRYTLGELATIERALAALDPSLTNREREAAVNAALVHDQQENPHA